MEHVIKLENIPVRVKKKDVLCQVGCSQESPVYEEVAAEYEALKTEMLALCRPVVLFRFAGLDESLATEKWKAGTPVVYALYSIGGEISRYSTAAFASGDYLKGMLSDAIADSLLFSLEDGAACSLKEACAQRQKGVAGRLEAPNDIPMEAQRVIHRETEAKASCGIGITSGFMFDPVKSSGVVYLLTDDEALFLNQHDCGSCSRTDCPMRRTKKEHQVTVEVLQKGKSRSIALGHGESILDGLREGGMFVSAVCGGRGSCGKCGIRLVKGVLPVTEEDRKTFSEDELEQGFRLSCRAFPQTDVTVETSFDGEETFAVLGSRPDTQQAQKADQYGIAIDIGTTTLAFSLVDMKTGVALRSYAAVNLQRVYGADVISRIKASCEGETEALKESIRKQLARGILELAEGITEKELVGVTAAGNTTMVHLLMGYGCESLGVYPFTPVTTERLSCGCRQLLGEGLPDVPFTVLPGISTFVGADIVAGMLECGFDQKEELSLLIDLGTNGEMALGNRERVLVTSTAAGPAFEGGNIRWGTGSVEGAICGVRILENRAQVETIGGKAPVGICGTGVLETAAELVRTGLVDETGRLDEAFLEEGFPLAETAAGRRVCFTQQDVREIQLAKAAVRAGMETLLLRYGAVREDVAHIYLAGGFGVSLDVPSAITIGLLPEEFSGKIEPVGNSSLKGAVRFLTEAPAADRAERIKRAAEEIGLSADPDFNQIYIEQIMFE